LADSRHLSFLPGLELPLPVRVTHDLALALRDRAIIVSATPSHFVRTTMAAARKSGAVAPKAVIVSVAKGLEEKTLKRMSEVIAEELRIPAKRITALTGPSHAEEVCQRMPTATIVAGTDQATVLRMQALFRTISSEFTRIRI